MTFLGLALLLCYLPGADNVFVPLQLRALGGVFIVATLFAFGSIAWLTGFYAQVLRELARAHCWRNRVSALVFVGLALRLARDSR